MGIQFYQSPKEARMDLGRRKVIAAGVVGLTGGLLVKVVLWKEERPIILA